MLIVIVRDGDRTDRGRFAKHCRIFKIAASAILSLQDDGCGVPQMRLEAATPGHFGVAGMRERAAKIGSQLTIQTPASGGTEVVLRVASRLAYASSAN